MVPKKIYEAAAVLCCACSNCTLPLYQALLLVLQKPLLSIYSPLLTSMWMYMVGAAGNTLLMTAVEANGVWGALDQMWGACTGSQVVSAALLYLVLADGVLA